MLAVKEEPRYRIESRFKEIIKSSKRQGWFNTASKKTKQDFNVFKYMYIFLIIYGILINVFAS